MTPTLRALLAESVEAARERERRAFGDVAGEWSRSIVLFGAGGLGRRCLAGLRRRGVEPVAFCDNNPRLWGSAIDGVKVLSPDEAARRFATQAVFVVSIWGARGADRMADRVRALQSLGCERVVPFGPWAWSCAEGVLPHYAVDLPHKVLQESPAVLEAFDLLADDKSRREYVAQVRWRLYFDFTGMAMPDEEPIYFPRDSVRLGSDEFFVDCGAFDGDTLSSFVSVSGGLFSRYVAFEPDPENFRRLESMAASLSDSVRNRIELKRAAVASHAGTVQFASGAGPSSHVGCGELTVESVALNGWLAGRSPSFIKMDIEGGEPDALVGASDHIRDKSPLLAISCYHGQDHLWSIPRLIHSINPDYAFHLRPHDLEGWDLVCYAVPRARRP